MTRSSTTTTLLIGAALLVALQASTAAAQQPTDVRDFVRQVFIEGIPYDEGSRFDASAVPALLEMLADPAEEDWWANAAVLLGIIGDERAFEPLVAFVDKDTEDGKLSLAHYRAKTSALMSLGYLLNKSGSDQALDYLVDRMYPEGWDKLSMASVGPYHADQSSRNEDFAKYAILGLALSGHPGAKGALDEFQSRDTDFQAAMNDMVVEALAAHEIIGEAGLSGYYEQAAGD